MSCVECLCCITCLLPSLVQSPHASWYVSPPFKGEELEGLRNQSKVTQLGLNSGLLPPNSSFLLLH